PRPEDMVPIDAALATELQHLLARAGDYAGPPSGRWDAATYAALERYGGRENLEERLLHDANDARIDRKVLDYLRAHAPNG
nr:fimbrial assembly protein FimA [Ktedonobacterales bacterium]